MEVQTVLNQGRLIIDACCIPVQACKSKTLCHFLSGLNFAHTLSSVVCAPYINEAFIPIAAFTRSATLMCIS